MNETLIEQIQKAMSDVNRRLDLMRVELNDLKTEVRDVTIRIDDLEGDR